MPGTVLGYGNTAEAKQTKILALKGLIFLGEKEIINK